MLLQKDNQLYMKIGDRFYLAEIIVKPYTIQILPTNEYVTELENAKEVSYREVKSRYIKEESTDVGSLNSSEA